MKLKNDVHSFCNPKIVYGLQGDSVKLVSDHGQVLIVEGVNGKRFSVKQSELTSQIIIKRKTEAEPDTAAPIKPNINQAPPVSKGAAPINQQQTLF